MQRLLYRRTNKSQDRTIRKAIFLKPGNRRGGTGGLSNGATNRS